MSEVSRSRADELTALFPIALTSFSCSVKAGTNGSLSIALPCSPMILLSLLTDAATIRPPPSPTSLKRVCSRATLEGRITLSEMRFITTSKDGGRQERTLGSEAEYAAVLRKDFGVVMGGS